jgi:hypothetical protein
VQLFPTDRALQLAEQLEPTRRATEELIEQALGLEDTATLRRILTQLHAALDSDEAVLERVAAGV